MRAGWHKGWSSPLTAELTVPAQGQERWFFVVPTPVPYDKAEAEFLEAVQDTGESPAGFFVLLLPRGGKCYATRDLVRFQALLPRAFDLGPPELTFVAANCPFDQTATEHALAGFVISVLDASLSPRPGQISGMHFDSGDLVEVFR